jgi:hypothetical protein
VAGACDDVFDEGDCASQDPEPVGDVAFLCAGGGRGACLSLEDESGEWLWAIGCGAVAEATLCSREDGSAGCSVGNAAGACDD